MTRNCARYFATVAAASALVLNLPFWETGTAYGQIAVTALPKTVAGGYNISCNNGTDGEVTTVVTGNTGPYTFSWGTSTSLSLTGATGSSINSLSAGTYWVTVTDSLNNTASDTVTLIQPSVLGVSIDAHTFAGGTHISEHGAADGEMYSDVTGGIPPYQYDWNTGAHDEWTYKDRPAGAYTLVVTDAGGCQADADQTLTEPDVFSASVQAVERASGYHLTGCGDSDGEAEITATGGVAPYTFYWMSGETDAHAYNLGEGEQEATVIDANGVERHVTFELLRPDKLAVEILTNDLYPNGYHISCHNCSNATLTAQLTGGAEPFEYFWYREQQNGTAQLQNAGDPFYNLTVRDAMGCTGVAFAKLRIPQRDDWSVNGNSGLDINGDPKRLGTNDSTDLMMKANNQPMLRLGADGNVDVLGQLRVPELASQTARLKRVGINQQGGFEELKPCVGLTSEEGGLPPGTVIDPQWDNGPSKIFVDYNCPVNVGIGTDNPQYRLQVNGDASIKKLLVGDATGNSATASIKALSSNPYAKTLEVLMASGEPTIQVLNSGKVELGDQAFTVYSANGTVAVGKWLSSQDPEAVLRIGLQEHNIIKGHWQDGMSFGVEGHADALKILKADGRVHIGGGNFTGNPVADIKLSVKGKIVTQEVYVTLEWWADDVFKKGYRLRTLQEEEQLIKQLGHLPDVPSEKEILETGVPLGQMDATLLRKVEELTLHMIEMDKRMKALEEENAKLKGQK